MYDELIGDSYSRILDHVLAHALEINLILDPEVARDLDLAYARALALNLDIDNTLNRGRALARVLDRALSLSLARTRALEHDHDHACDRDRARTRARTRDRARTRARALALTRARALDLALDRDYALDLELCAGIVANVCESIANLPIRGESVKSFERVWQKIKGLAQITSHLDLSKAMDKMNILKASAPQKEWLDFANITRALINQHLDVGYKWNFTEEDYETLGNIFLATKLMLECLDVATVSPEVRQRVRDNILTIDE